MDKRTQARELAMQALYQLDAQGSDFLNRLGLFLRENCSNDKVFSMADEWTRQAWANVAVCDELISDVAEKWDLSRLCLVDKSILRLSVYQVRFRNDIPGKVVINEAIEMAKKFSSEQSPRFVNGVLDAVYKKLKNSTVV